MFVVLYVCFCLVFCFFKQKTAYEVRISDGSSDVCSSDLFGNVKHQPVIGGQFVCEPLPVSGRVRSQVDHRVEDSAARAANQFRLCVWRRLAVHAAHRSEVRRVGKVCVSTGRSMWSPDHLKKNTIRQQHISNRKNKK